MKLVPRCNLDLLPSPQPTRPKPPVQDAFIPVEYGSGIENPIAVCEHRQKTCFWRQTRSHAQVHQVCKLLQLSRSIEVLVFPARVYLRSFAAVGAKLRALRERRRRRMFRFDLFANSDGSQTVIFNSDRSISTPRNGLDRRRGLRTR